MDAGPDGTYIVEPVFDLQLQMLIHVLVEQSDENRIPVTLNIPGTIIYGHMVSGSAWRTRWVERVGAMGGDGKDHLSFFPSQLRSALDEVVPESGTDADKPMPRFIHLLDATMVTGAMNTTVEVPLWRGRLADVSGWSIGVPD